MTRLRYRFFIFMASGLLLVSGSTFAQPGNAPDEKPPIAQPLVREGDLAVKLTEALKLGSATSEAEAESILGSVGILPRNGWIADYPVTPDIIGELQTAIGEAAAAGKLGMGRDEALKASQAVLSESNLSIRAGAPVQQGSTVPGTNYPESPVINNYYYDERPACCQPTMLRRLIMHTCIRGSPIRSGGWNFCVPWVLYHGGFLRAGVWAWARRTWRTCEQSLPRMSEQGGISRIDPASRAHGGTLPDRRGSGLSSPSARSGAQAILRRSQGGVTTGASRVFRGYGERPPAGTRPSAYQRPRNSQFERAASDRGFQSRSNAGRITNQVPGVRGGRAVSPSVPRQNQGGRGASGGTRGAVQGGPGGDGGGFHGGARR